MKFFTNLLFLLGFCSSSVFCASQSHHPEDFLRSIKGNKDEGKQIVQHFCSSCHAVKPMISLGAPRIGIDSDWLPRVEKGLDALFKNTENGFNAMPARGGCFECSDEQLILAIYHLLPKDIRKELKDHKKNKMIK